jgi:hypothetical protein
MKQFGNAGQARLLAFFDDRRTRRTGRQGAAPTVTNFGFRHLGNEVIPGEYYEK